MRKFLQLFRWDEGGPDQAFQPQERDGVSGDCPEGQSPGGQGPTGECRATDSRPLAECSRVSCPMSVTWVSSFVMWGKRVHESWGGQEDPWTRHLNPSQGPGAPSLSPPLGLPFQKLVCEPGALGSLFSSAPKGNPIRPSRIFCHLKVTEAQPRVKCRSHGGEQLLLWDRRQVAPSLGPSGERADLAALWDCC